MTIESTVYVKQPTRHTMYGAAIPKDLRVDVSSEISGGLVKRLVSYAIEGFESAGFMSFVREARLSVYTVDGDLQSPDRSYCVRAQCEKGGYIEMIGILTSKGWPTIDHGFYIGRE